MSGVCQLSDVLQDALTRVRDRLDTDSITGLLEAIGAAEERLRVDLLHVCLFSDGSGHVMAPMRDYSGEGERTDDTGFEAVAEFQTPDELMAWLREGTLPETAGEEAARC